MFWNRNRVEEDLQRIREANLPREKEKAREAADRLQKTRDLTGRIGVKDVVAMILAIFSLILPYVVAFVLALGLFVVLFLWWV